MLGIGLSFPSEPVRDAFSEEGPVEAGSVWLWVGLAALIPLAFRRMTIGVAAGMYVSLCCAARESDWHRSFTDYSVLKPGFYLKGEHAIEARLIAGAIVGLLGVSACVLVLRLTRRALAEGWPPRPWLRVALIGLGTLVGTKLLDRLTGVVADWAGYDLTPRMRAVVAALEEGLESVLAVVFGVAVVSAARATRRLAGQCSGSPRGDHA